MKYTKEFLLSELERYIEENKELPQSKNIRVKFGYPPLNAYITEFGTFSNAIYEMENSRFPIEQVNTDLISKYTILCQDEIYKLALKYTHMSVFEISEILQIGYLLGIEAEAEAVELIYLESNYL